MAQKFFGISAVAFLISALMSSATGAAQSETRSRCLEIPDSVQWGKDLAIGGSTLKSIGDVTLVDLEGSISRRMPTFGQVDIGSGVFGFHATAMTSLLVDNLVGAAVDPRIHVRSISGSDNADTGLDDAHLSAILAKMLKSVGVDANGNVTGAPRRLVLAMPIGATAKLRRSQKLIAAGLHSGRVLSVVSTGNENRSTVSAPASFAESVAVGGVEPSGDAWEESATEGANTGPETDVIAPACQSVVVIDPQDIPAEKLDARATSNPNAKKLPPTYYVTNGTSNAAMYAAAVAARIWAAHPSMHAVQVKRALQSTGGEPHTNNRGFGVARLSQLPADETAPTVAGTVNGNTVNLGIADNMSPPMPDGLPGAWGQSGIAAVAYRFNGTGAWTVKQTSNDGPSFFARPLQCIQLCTLNISARTITSVEVRAIDSTQFQRLNGQWDGETGLYGRWTYQKQASKSGAPKTVPPTTVATTVASSKTPTTTTTTPPKTTFPTAEFDVWRQNFAAYPDQIDVIMAEARAMFPPEYVPPGNIFDLPDTGKMLGPLAKRICAIQNEIDEKRYAKWPGYPNYPADSNPRNLFQVCVPTFVFAHLQNAILDGRGKPVGQHPDYEKDFVEKTWIANNIRAFVNHTPWPTPPK